MLIEQDLILAIEPRCYRRWAQEARAHAGDAGALAQLRDPEAAMKLTPGRKSVGDIAVVDLRGFITQKPSMMSLLFGGTSTEGLTGMLRSVMAEPSIGAVILNVDSPGGVVSGVPEAATTIRGMRGAKPMVAVANPLAASAAYWLASQADEIAVTPSGEVGSIGVYVAHVDESKGLQMMGLNVTEMTYGRRKAEESSAKPLSDEARAGIQQRLDYFGRLFEGDVAKGRGRPVSTVRSGFGEGSMFTATGAQSAGLVDRIATLEDVIGGLARGQRPAPRAEYDPAEMAAMAALAGFKLPQA